MLPDVTDHSKYPSKETRDQQRYINQFFNIYADNLSHRQILTEFKVGYRNLTVGQALQFVSHHIELQEMSNCEVCNTVVGMTCSFCADRLKHDTELMYYILSDIQEMFFPQG